MKFTILLLVTLLISSSLCYRPELVGPEWESLKSYQKKQVIQDKINADPTPASFFYLKLAELFVQDNNLSFTTKGDEMPVQGWPIKVKRDKLIHPVGVIAQCEFVSTDSSHIYTGIFKGVKNAFVRFSLAGPVTGKTFVPAFVFKFLRDGRESANIFSMYSLRGQEGNSNIFEHDYSSHVPMLSKPLSIPETALLENFKKVSDYPVFLGLSHAARYDEHGNDEGDKTNFPFRIQFHPTKEAHEFMSSHLKIDNDFFFEPMENLDVQHLFDVYVQQTPQSTELYKIGEINLKTRFQTSGYADQTLYHQHQKFEEDLELKPWWEKNAQKIMEEQYEAKSQFHYADVPY